MQSFRIFLLFLALFASLSSCLKAPAYLAKTTGSLQNTGALAPIKLDSGGVLSATLSATSGAAQEVGASAGSAISSARVSFPVGALALDTVITVEEGASLASSSFSSELGATNGLQVAKAGAAIAVTSSVPMDAATPFTLAIPLSSSSGLHLTDSDQNLLIVIYKVYKEAEGKIVVGVIPNSELKISGATISFDTVHFGVYQAALADRPVEKKIEVQTKAPILTKAAEAKLADIIWKPVSLKYTASTRKLTATTSAENLVASRCAAFYDADKTEPFDFVANTNAKLTTDIVVPGNVGGTYFVAFECLDQSGRVSRSGWSDAMTVKAVAVAPASTPPPQPATPQSQSQPIDTKPPQVTAFYPAADEMNVNNFYTPNIVFSKNISIASVNASSFKLLRNLGVDPSSIATTVATTLLARDVSNGNDSNTSFPTESPEKISGTFQVAENMGAFAPDKPLPLATKLTAILAPGLRDLANNAMTAPTSWSFTTRDGNWHPPVNLPFTINPVLERHATGPAGSIVMAYTENDGTFTRVFARFSRNGIDWINGNALLFTYPTEYGPINVTPIIDGAGNATVVMVLGDKLLASRLNLGSTSWPVNPAAFDLPTDTLPTLVGLFLTPNNSVSVVYYSLAGGTKYFSSNFNGTTWNGASTLAMTTQSMSARLASYPGKGAVLIAAQPCPTSATCFEAVTSIDGLSWSPQTQILQVQSSTPPPAIQVVDRFGNISVLAFPMVSQLSSQYEVAAVQLPANSSIWPSTPKILTFGSGASQFVDASLEDDGTIDIIVKKYNMAGGVSRYDYFSFRYGQGDFQGAPLAIPALGSLTTPTVFAGGPEGTNVFIKTTNCADTASLNCVYASYMRRSSAGWSNYAEIARFGGPLNVNQPIAPLIDASGNITVLMQPFKDSTENYFVISNRLSSFATTWPGSMTLYTSILELNNSFLNVDESGQISACFTERQATAELQVKVARFD